MPLFSRTRVAAELPYPPHSPEGLAARWVRWVAAAGPVRNPVADETGDFAGLGQPDDVWFLAGTFGGDVERRCAIPARRSLFFPLFNIWYDDPDGPPHPERDAVGTLTVDGARFTPDVIATPRPFEVAGVFRNPVTGTRQPIAVTVWGLWKRLDPLPPGRHEVRFSGSDGHDFNVSATYHLTVA
ncbi:MAG: hypothetical protein HOV79_13675 [Hamadaea sp.]|nr:hypothetical protein [Hamadaea sp.]